MPFQNDKLSPVIFFRLSTLKGTIEARTVNLLRLNTLRGIKTTFLTPKRYIKHPILFMWVIPPPRVGARQEPATNTQPAHGTGLESNHRAIPTALKSWLKNNLNGFKFDYSTSPWVFGWYLYKSTRKWLKCNMSSFQFKLHGHYIVYSTVVCDIIAQSEIFVIWSLQKKIFH